MTICNLSDNCIIEDHQNITCDCEGAEWVQEYADNDLGKSACRCCECIEEIEG